ncbi:MAG: FlgD immunoglobulin-like domain containing protein [Armatimonadota bacterium]|nr:FlgD immunoglobulin-like domain containing protein [Armatimonadota bacterium]
MKAYTDGLMSRGIGAVIIVAVTATVLVGGAFAPAVARTTERVSVANDGSQGSNYSALPSISADGRYVAFEALASNLVPGDTNNYRDVFVHDRHTGQTTRVSVASDGWQANHRACCPSISADGRYVAFEALSSNLVPGDTNGWWDVFVHDQQTGQTTRVSVASDGIQADGLSFAPSISADGRYVAFYSDAVNLVPVDTNGWWDVFVHDQQTGQTTRVSVASDGTQGNDRSRGPSISADGRYVAFNSYASNLVPGDTNGQRDIFVHDPQTGQTTRVSVASDRTQANGGSYRPSISADGHYLAFESWASNLVPADTNRTGDVFVHDRHDVTITSGPSATPSPVAPEGDVQCSVTAECSLGHHLVYEWTAEDAEGNPAGSFDDATLREPIWTAPENATDSVAQYTISATVTCSEDENVTATASFTQKVSPVAHTITITEDPSGTPNPVVSGGDVQCSVTAEDSRGHGLLYQWTAEDAEGNPAGSFDDATLREPIWTAPENATDSVAQYTISATVTCSEDENVTATASFTQQVLPTLTVALQPGWNMISIGQPADQQATFRDLLGPEVLALYGWNAAQFQYDQIDMDTEVAADYSGYGFWALTVQDMTCNIPVRTPSNVTVDVGTGWNLLGNPYEFDLNLDGGLVPDGGDIILPGYWWNGTAYEQQAVWGLGRGYWVLANYEGSATFHMAPPLPPAGAESISLAQARDDVDADACIQLAAQVGDRRDVSTWIGTTADGDALRTPKPPMMPGGVGTYLDVEDGIGYARSLVPQGEDHTWTLTVDSPQEEVSLRIVDTSELPGDMAVWLTDQATGTRVDLRHAPGYTYTAREEQRTFEIELAERDDLLQVMGVSAQAAGEGAQISFTLSAAGQVTVDVLNIAGRTVKRLVADRECDAGLQTVSWDGRSDSGTQVPSGIYLIRVTATAPTGEQAQGLATMAVR